MACLDHMSIRPASQPLVKANSLPVPLENIVVIYLGVLGFPSNVIAAIRLGGHIRLGGGLTTMLSALDQAHTVGPSLGWEGHVDLQLIGKMDYVRFPVTCRLQETIVDLPLDIELVDITSVLHFLP